MRLLFDRATLWEYLPLGRRNPLELVKIKRVTKRIAIQDEMVETGDKRTVSVGRQEVRHVQLAEP
jgi:hypothetical protein